MNTNVGNVTHEATPTPRDVPDVPRAMGDAGCKTWDAVVIGAGPAGSVSAALLAERGWRVLLVERAAWPRDKACGGCLNAAGVALLRAAQLGETLAGAAPLHTMNLHMGARHLAVPLPAGAVVERRALDARLVAAAVERGTNFTPATAARLMPPAPEETDARRVHLRGEHGDQVVRAGVVLACDGLQGGSLAGEAWAHLAIHRPARLGFAATIGATAGAASTVTGTATVPAAATPPGVLSMCVGPGGYVGVVDLGGGRTHIGAALWPQACHRAGGPRTVIDAILRHCALAPLPAEELHFRGTGPLTVRRACVAGPRVLAVGDACGYIEPFTGEGLAWAIRGAVEVAALLPRRANEWHEGLPAAWQVRFETEVRRRQRWCWRLRALLRRPRLASACLALAGFWPGAPAQIAQRISA